MPTTEAPPKQLTSSDCTDVFAEPGNTRNIIDIIHPGTGLSWHSQQNLEQIRERYPTAVVMKFDDYMAAKAEAQNPPVTWSEVTEERYMEMLEVLPPACWGHGAFCVGEPYDHCAKTGKPRFSAYRRLDGKYWEASRPVTVKELSALIGHELRNDYIS